MLEERSGKDKFSDVTLLTLLFAESRSETRRKHVKTKIWQLMLDADQSRSRLLCSLYTLHCSDHTPDPRLDQVMAQETRKCFSLLYKY